ncbi:NAD(P)H-binding protein [Streptomyces sp. NPDC004111]|uniref:NAD(P)H-binding protein n=1 Tax=Streptomyces sp. NPDC004111 TaxID=3364690 RepID=UPI003682B313
MSFLLTGARGQVARAVAERLVAAGHGGGPGGPAAAAGSAGAVRTAGSFVRVASARPAELVPPDGTEAVEMVLDRPETFAAALAGVRQVFLYPVPAGIHELIKAAEAAGVEHVVLMSSAAVLASDAETHPIAAHHLQVERALAESALTSTFLRPGAFASNSFSWAGPIGQGQPVALPYPDARVVPIHPADIADIAFAAMTGAGEGREGGVGGSLAGRTVALTGAEPLSFREQLAIIAEETGREVRVEHIGRAEAEEQMGRHMPARMVTALLDIWAAAEGGPAEIADTTETLLGRPARTFRQWARENAGAFEGR